MLVGNIAKALLGKREAIELCVTALIADGHVLIEDEPGTGKTQLARALARSVDVGFNRIQFTADLLPADVTGASIYDRRTGLFSFRRGPVFASIVLADEVNRASPKTQSALLEAMEERRGTADGVTHVLPSPFMVIATANPSEHLGTYRLPMAQLDRFLLRVSIGHPSRRTSVELLMNGDAADRAATVSPVIDARKLHAMSLAAQRVHLDGAVAEYIVRLVEATRHDERLVTGASTRGALGLARCAKVRAAAEGRTYVVPEDVRSLAVSLLAHRVSLDPQAALDGLDAQTVVSTICDEVPAPLSGSHGMSPQRGKHSRPHGRKGASPPNE